MRELARKDARIRIFHLSRNFGSDAATLCGLVNATGDCAVVKAADLQEPSEMLLDMYRSWQSGNNVVLAVREGREESRSQEFFADLYYAMTRKFALPGMPKKGFDVFCWTAGSSKCSNAWMSPIAHSPARFSGAASKQAW